MCRIVASIKRGPVQLHLVGELADAGDVFLLEADHRHLNCLALECTSRDTHHVEYRMRRIGSAAALPRFPLHVRIASPRQDLTVFDPPGLGTLVRSVLQPASPTLVS